MRETVRYCARCAQRGKQTELDLTSPGTRDAVFTITYPAWVQEEIGLCAKHAEPVWALEGLGTEKPGGTFESTRQFPYLVEGFGPDRAV